MTKKLLVLKLLSLHTSMIDIATDMEYYGGADPELKAHSKELLGAADVVMTWIGGLEGDKKRDVIDFIKSADND